MSITPELSPQNPSPDALKKAVRQFKRVMTSSYGVAAIASLAFHGVLLTAIPRFSSVSFAAFDEENTAETRTVPLVTLSPTEQGRLPDFNRPQLPSIPDITSSTPLTKLPNPGILDRSSRFLSPTAPSLSSPSRLSRNRVFRNPFITRPNFSIANTPSRSGQSSANRTTGLENIPPPPPGSELEIETNRDTLERQLELEQQREQTAPENGADAAELSDANDDISSTPGDMELAAASETDGASQLEKLQARFNYSAEDTTDEEAEAAYAAWIEQTQGQSEDTIETVDTEILTLEPGLNLCAKDSPRNGAVGLLVAPDGSPVDAVVLRSTGYEYLNDEALEALVDSDFPETETPVRYAVEVVIDYDAETCRSFEDVLETVQNNEQTAAEPAEGSSPSVGNEQGSERDSADEQDSLDSAS
ncbi:MAG: energy transducer TonB [Cyanobacteria bacterium P01_H01_bin.26]